ncbi:hypothetical protein NFI96_014931, partial [Prochilodus magdalenae]
RSSYIRISSQFSSCRSDLHTMVRRNRNARLSNAEIRSAGLDFIEFLQETNRIGIVSRDELQEIYNTEFRDRDGGVRRDPNFSTILYVLSQCHKARVTRARQVYFKPTVRVVLRDQWWRPHNTEQRYNSNSPLPSDTPEASSSPTPAPSGPEGGVRARRKLARELIDKIKNDRPHLVADKNGVHISFETEVVDGQVSFCVERREVYEQTLFVENRGTTSVYFTYYSLLHWIHCFMFEDDNRVTRNNPLLLSPGESYEVKMKFFSEEVGVYRAMVVFEFKPSIESFSRPFHIVRYIEAEFRTQLAAELAPIAPYKPFRLSSVQKADFTVDEGEPPQSFYTELDYSTYRRCPMKNILALNRLGIVVPLQDYNCPKYINELDKFLKDPSCPPKAHLQEKKSLLESPLSFQNYAERFHLLLYLEESQMHVDIKRYNKDNVTMKKDQQNKKLLVLEVPGVSENRPSVLRGDHLLLTKSKDLPLQSVTKYKGYVHRVELDTLKLHFSSRFLDSFIDKMSFRVEFTFNRLLMRLQHRAVQLAVQDRLDEVLFPTGSNSGNSNAQLSLSLFDRSLEQNHEQYTTVCNIVAGVSKPAPYLVFGPPGTGKTVTMVEAIKQVEKSGSDVHILACAPSNSATDQLCEKLLQHVDPRKVYRMYALSRSPDQVPLTLRASCNLKGEVYEFPAKQELMQYKIVVTTVFTAGRLVSGGLPVGHFTHIFVDEAGHAVESEAIIGIAGLLHAEKGQVVLAGDPKQLGPILRSPIAIQYGLGLSLLERLMTKNPLYQKGEAGFNTRYVTKLLRNYRSHRAILKVPNEMFYDGELQPCADEYSANLYCSWERLPKKGFPQIFHGVYGKDERESDSPSFFNTAEITKVIDYLKELLLTQGKNGIPKISPKDIGIITPYRKQVEKLRKAIRKVDRELKDYKDIDKLKVGSVEEFQGQERRVIIVSTVRSSNKYIGIDRDFNIGFLSNEKRFNVAITRAKSLLIVVGNPIILSSDNAWARFIQYCTAEGGYTGFDRSIIEDTEEVIERLAALRIQMEPEEFLHETKRIGITNRVRIQEIYNNEFRVRESGGLKDPRFSSVLYALRQSSKARVRSGRVYFSRNVRVVYRDQWWRPRDRQQSSSRSSPLPPNDLVASSSTAPSHPGPDGGVRARRKLAREMLNKLKNDRSEFVADKHGVHISSETEMVNEKICFCVEREEVYEQKLFVENRGTSSVYFTYYSPLHWIHCFMFEDAERVTRNKPLLLGPGETYEIKVMFRAEHVGVYRVTMAFEFKASMQESSRPFHIVRFIEAEFRTQLAAELAPVERYRHPKVSSVQTDNFTVEDGMQPEGLSINHLHNEVLLLQYKCPSYINDLTKFLTNCSRAPSSHLQEMKSLLESPLSFHNYVERFQVLLHLEESQMHVDIKSYDKKDVTMTRDKISKNLLILEVPGVTENRPSVLRGDHLLLTKSADLDKQFLTKYKGYVHRVELDRLKLGFSSRLLAGFIDNMKFQVEFTVNRLMMRLQHRAVQLAVQHKLDEVLFPTGSKSMARGEELSLRLFDRSLEENIEQYTAVCNIVAGVSKPAPYLVFGPPGTGKTVTMVEAIKQVAKNIADVHILACAPSNSAADQLCEKLLKHVDAHKIYRMYACSREPKHVPEDLLACSNLRGEVYEFPTKEELMEYTILLTTVCTAGRLVTGGLPVGHFTHIFVDEAGHAVESEAIIAIAGLLCAETGQLVLAGDPKQLGPILRSPIAIKYGLGLSLLARLMTKNPLYQKGETGFNTRYVTKLLRNYRSHKSILKVPNEMFYEGELLPFADEFSTSFYCNWEYLPKRNFPVIFHGVLGKDERELNSPSFFNTSEIIVVLSYLKKLLVSQGKKGTAKISPKDIGIITPYRKQVEKLRKAIITCDKELKGHRNIKELKIGSVEEFQGQERRVIIVSTVRSENEFIKIDQVFNIGFLNNEKRFNVAMTRARSLLIVVGNPIILSSDSTWSRFIQYCTDEGGYTGLNRDIIEGTEEVVTRLTALSIQETEVDTVNTKESGIQQYVNPEWKHEQ